MKKGKKELNEVVKIIKYDGVKERVWSAKSCFWEWSAEEKQLKYKYENDLYIPEIVTLFYDMSEKMNKIPTQNEYVDEYIRITMIQLTKKDWYDPFRKDFFLDCIIWRADRSYKSNLVEIMTAGQLELKGYKVFRHLYIDYVLGVDLVAVKDDKCWYIHVTKDSKWARDKVFKKGTYRNYTVNGQKIVFQRDFKKHVQFLYDCESSDKNIINNGLPLFRHDYVLKKLDDEHALSWSGNQLKKLVKEMKYKKAESGNFCFKSLDEKLVVA
jgi:hypothetical protein